MIVSGSAAEVQGSRPVRTSWAPIFSRGNFNRVQHTFHDLLFAFADPRSSQTHARNRAAIEPPGHTGNLRTRDRTAVASEIMARLDQIALAPLVPPLSRLPDERREHRPYKLFETGADLFFCRSSSRYYEVLPRDQSNQLHCETCLYRKPHPLRRRGNRVS